MRDHSARVYRLAYRLTGNHHDAEDLTQEVFVRVFRSLSTYTPGTFEGWLHRITTNLFLDMVRRKQRIRFDAPRRRRGRAAAEPRAVARSRSSTTRTSTRDVQQALDTLAPEFRAAVVLCDIEGLSYEEIAATLGVKLGTVRSRIHRGRSQLRKRAGAPLARPASGRGISGSRSNRVARRWQPASQHRGTRGVREGAFVRRAGRAPLGLRRRRPG